jgi:carbonic anhydrase
MSIIDNAVRANREYAKKHDRKLAQRPAPKTFFSFKDPEQHTREQIEMVRSHPWIAKDVAVRGFVFNMETGLLTEVESPEYSEH